MDDRNFINAWDIKSKREEYFKETFDFDTFGKYLEKMFVDKGKNIISVEYKRRQYIDKPTDNCKDLSFDNTSVYVSTEIMEYLIDFLQSHGFFIKKYIGYFEISLYEQ